MQSSDFNHIRWLKQGIKDGIPIALGYFAVSFTLGIAARNAGLSAFQAGLTSLLCLASAGQYAGFTLIAASASYLEVAVMTLVVNARYLLMSCALSQKLSPDTPIWKRMLIAYPVTDEIFGVEVSVSGYLSPWYTVGLAGISAPGWTAGTCLGVILGNILPGNVVSALSVGLYGMFLAVIIPPARKSRILACLIAISMAASWICSVLPPFSQLSEGMRIILLTILLAGIAAVLFPHEEGEIDS